MSLGAGSELFGQRLSRNCHHSSNIRMLVSMACYCSVQAFVVLGVLQLVLPESWTGGQGSLSMWSLLSEYPGLWVNAFNNSVYWLALSYVLREPLGPVLVVLAFLFASFLVDPFQELVGLSVSNHLTADAVVLGLMGTLLCVVDIPIAVSRRASARIRSFFRCAPPVSPPPPSAELPKHHLAHTPSTSSDGEADEFEGQGLLQHANNDGAPVINGITYNGKALHAVSVLVAFTVLAVTTGIGITVTTYFETHAGLNSFGYAAIDQVLLPFTTLPLAAFLDSFAWPRRLIGEPPWSSTSELPPHFGHTLMRTWAEVNSVPSVSSPPVFSPSTGLISRIYNACSRPWSFWFTLVPFHGFEFVRTLLFFYLVTQFDVDATYMQMTLLRIVLCWIGSLVACRFMPKWVGLTSTEVSTTLHPFSLSVRVAGSGCLLLSILRLKDII